jgi:hypothetical protein
MKNKSKIIYKIIINIIIYMNNNFNNSNSRNNSGNNSGNLDIHNFNEIKRTYFDELPENIAMKTAVWGPPTWFFLHSMAMAYPKHIDKTKPEHKKIKYSMYNFLASLGDVLPCGLCGNSYNQYIKTSEFSIWKYLDSREDLVYFIYLIHERVNDKLGVPKCDRPSFENVVKYYNKFRARGPCTATTEKERIDSLLAGCNEIDIKKGQFKNYKCIVNVIDKNDNNNQISLTDDFKNKEKFGNGNDNGNKNGSTVFLIILIVILILIIILLTYLLMKK